MSLCLSLGLSPAKFETLGAVDTIMLPELGVDSVGKLTELGADAFWDLGLYKDLDSLGRLTHGFGIVGLHFPQALLVLLGKEFEAYPTNRFITFIVS